MTECCKQAILFSKLRQQVVHALPLTPTSYCLLNLESFLYSTFLGGGGSALGLHCCTQAFSSVASGGYTSLRCMGVSFWWLLLLQSTGSRAHRPQVCIVGSWALEQRLSSCGARAQLLWSMWNLDWTRIPCTGRSILNQGSSFTFSWVTLTLLWILHKPRHFLHIQM